MIRRGFTLIELAICLTITAVLVPLIYAYARDIDDRSTLGIWHLDTADDVRTVAETLGRDARQHTGAGGDPLSLRIGDCAVQYVVDDAQNLERRTSEPCGGTRVLARGVAALTPTAGGVDLTFARRMRVDRTHRITVFIPVVPR